MLMQVLNSKGLWDHEERSLFGDPEVFFGKAWSLYPGDVSQAASVLGEIGPEAQVAVPILREALAATNRFIRASAVEALWKIEGDAQATVREILQIQATECPPSRGRSTLAWGPTRSPGNVAMRSSRLAPGLSPN